MDDADRSYGQPDRYSRDVDPRDPRAAVIPGRHIPPVTSGYIPEPGYPAYSISTAAQPSVPQMAFEPRTFAPAGNTTPPTGIRAQPGFPQSEFPPRPAQQPAPMPPQPYMDQRPGPNKMVNTYPYSTDPRHRR